MAMSGKDLKTEQLVETPAGSDFLRYLAEEVWPKAPPDQLDCQLSSEEEDEILGYGPEGV